MTVNTAASTATREFKIASVADLLPLLEHADPQIRAAAFSSVGADPHKALSLAPDRGRDIVDFFLDMLEAPLAQREKIPLLSVLGQFQDTRVDDVFLKLLLGEDSDDALLHIAARYISDTGLVAPVDGLLQLLRSNDNMSKNRIAAELLFEHKGLVAGDLIRIAAFSSGRTPFPALNGETADAWRQQLDSPLRDYLCLVLETRGPALENWTVLWPTLVASLQNWLVRCACNRTPPVESIIRLGLDSALEEVRSASASAIRLYGLQLHGSERS